ncbi:MAG: UDP-N-acetylmuramoyl-tripeptide--D-alanyl-D-alanine ligase [Jatrophihabitans sp.]|nr:MAG: UDP-N-acetylmuramoyl-tripeptide--D-alanyl-D-alanine ligase [Jatrophihabitans sp.]
MIALTLAEIADIVGGTLVAPPTAVVTGTVEFDSRRVGPGGLFLALRGDRVDGHDFVPAALAAGAVAALVTRPVPGPHILVADGLAALAALAARVVRRLPATVVGVTGSSGKTSTKDLLAQLLGRLGPTVAPPGSFNNELGHPYTVLRAGTDTRFLVLENSARGIGHIRYLAAIAPPRIGVVLNVGSAHLGEFGSREAIARAKGELVEALPADGLAVLNADDPLVLGMRGRTAARVRTFGRDPGADVRAEAVRADDLGRAGFTLVTQGTRAPVRLRLVGAHHIGNALAAAAVATECGMTVPEAADALTAAGPVSHWRMEVTERPDGAVVINDAYNANPESMRAALETLAAIAAARSARPVAVLGEMAELGPQGPTEHARTGRLAVELGIARLVAVGEAARAYDTGTTGFRWVPDAAAALALLRAEIGPGDVVLVKASRAASLERIALAIAEDGLAAAGPAGSRADRDEGGGSRA